MQRWRLSAWMIAAASGLLAATVQASAPALPAGEALVYDVKFGFLTVGEARMEVLGRETLRGRQAWHTRLVIDGGVIGYRVRDVLESWTDAETGDSLRFAKDTQEGSAHRSHRYEIDPELGVYARDGKPERPTVAHPLDDAAFLYFLRSQSLEVGRSYGYSRYFLPDRNPVSVTALRLETINVPAGTFDTLVLRPVIHTEGAFAEGGRAELWLSNDARRWMIQLKTHLKFGTSTLRLREARLGA